LVELIRTEDKTATIRPKTLETIGLLLLLLLLNFVIAFDIQRLKSSCSFFFG